MAMTQQSILKTGTDEVATTLPNRLSKAGYLSSPIVTIVCEESRNKYLVHKSLLTDCSPYFTKCLRQEFKEGQTLQVELREIDEAELRVFLHWLYTNSLESSYHTRSGTPVIETYRLADRFMIIELKDMLVDKLRRILRSETVFLETKWLILLQRYSLISTKLGRLLIAYFAYSIYNHRSDPQNIDFGAVDMRDIQDNSEIAAAILGRIPYDPDHEWHNPVDVDPCAYHDHSGTSCSEKEAWEATKYPHGRL